MPIDVVPNRIELSEITGGFAPDPIEAAVSMDASPEMSNLLPGPGGSLELRNGFTRLSAGRLVSLEASHWIRHVSYYELIDSGTRKRYLMCVLTNGTDADPNNIRIYAYDLVNDTFTRVDTAGRSWTNASTEHWSAVIEGTFYGGTRGEEIYSWHPTDGWNADPTLPTADTWVDSVTPSAGQKARNYAFKKGDTVLYSSSYYRAARGIRYRTWESGQRYSKGEKISRKAAEGADTYWRSFECIKSHTAGADSDEPGTGANTTTYWKRIRLQNVLDADSDVTGDWWLNPVARKSSVGAYHGNRLFVRADDDDNRARLQYSAPAKPERGAVIADLDFDPTDWAPVDDSEGEGGGWFNVPFSGKGDAIRALWSFGNYLIIAGRWQSYVLVGTNEATWSLRPLGKYGALSPQSIAEVRGIVYMIGRHGVLTMTDGTAIEPVPGMEKIQEYLKEQIDDVISSGSINWFPSLVAHDDMLWISLPDPSGADMTIVYDPATQSFWETNLRFLDMATGEAGGTSRLFFSTAVKGLAGESPCLFQYKDDPGNETYTDDDWQATDGTADTNDITWNWRSAWMKFGAARNERRIRRVWGLVSGEAAQSVVVRVFKSFVDGTYATTASRSLTGQATKDSEYVEGKVGQSGMVTSAVGVRLSGSANARTAVHGVGVDTEPVRIRFKRG